MLSSSLILKEISHRKISFFSAVLLSAFALLCLLISIALLNSFDGETKTILTEHQKKSEVIFLEQKEKSKEILKKLEDDIRKSMKGLGFNIFIFPEGQNLAEVYSKGFASKTMPENYVHKLAETKSLAKINHLLPRLVKKFTWPEQ